MIIFFKINFTYGMVLAIMEANGNYKRMAEKYNLLGYVGILL